MMRALVLMAVVVVAACNGDATPDARLGPPPIDAASPDGGPPDATPLPECDNALDDDGDAIIDFPFEPGCESTVDDDETDPALPCACADGLDNDEDGATDYPADDDCTYAADCSEFSD